MGMGLIKYRNTETGQLMLDEDLFVKQLHISYPFIVPDFLVIMVRTIEYCIIDECNKGNLLRGKKVGLEDVPLIFEKMELIKDKNVPLPEDLKQISHYYEDFIVLVRDPDVKALVRYLYSHGHEDFSAVQTRDDVQRVVLAARGIFDRIRSASEAGWKGELCVEEVKWLKHSKNPVDNNRYKEYKKKKLEAINTLWKSQNAETTFENTSEAVDDSELEGGQIAIKRARKSISF